MPDPKANPMGSQPPRSSPDLSSGRHPGWLVGCAATLLFLIPFGVMGWLLDLRLQQQALDTRAAIRQNQREIAAHVLRLAQPLSHAQERLDRLARALRWHSAAVAEIGAGMASYSRIFVFDAAGRRLALRGTTPGLVRASETVLRLIRERANSGANPPPRDERLVAQLLGDPQAIPHLARCPGRMLDLESIGQRLYAGFMPVRDFRGATWFVLAIIDRDRIPIHEIARRALTRFSWRARGEQAFGITDLTDCEPPWFSAAYPIASHPVLAYRRECETEDRLLVGTVIARRFLVGVAQAVPPARSWLTDHRATMALSTIAATLAFLLIWMRLIQHRLTLRNRVLLQVTVAGLGAVVALLGAADAFLQGREAAIIRTRLTAGDAMLARADAGFDGFRSRLTRQFARLANRLQRAEDDEARRRELAALDHRWRHWLSVFLCDDTGRIRAHSRPGLLSTLEIVFGRDATRLVGRIGHWAWRARDWQAARGRSALPPEIEQENPMIRYGAKDFLQHAGTIRTMQAGSLVLDRYQEYIPVSFRGATPMPPGGPTGASTGPRLALAIYLEDRCDQRCYLHTLQRRWRQSAAPASFSLEIRGLPTEGLPLPPDRMVSPRARELLRFNDRVTGAGAPQHARVRFADQDWLLVGRPGERLAGFNLIVTIPLAPIQRDSAALVTRFRWLAAIVLLFSLAIGNLFADLVTTPLQRVLAGLGDLAEARFASRIEVVTGDEIETLAHGINRLLEEMQQLVAAGRVHRRMVPPRPLRSGRLTAVAAVRYPSEIGNQIADVCTFAGGGLAMMLMSLTDRSLAAALRLAAARVRFRLRLARGVTDPTAILTGWAPPGPPSERLHAPPADERPAPESADDEAPADLLFGLADPASGAVRLAWRGAFQVLTQPDPHYAGSAPLPPRMAARDARFAQCNGADRQDGARAPLPWADPAFCAASPGEVPHPGAPPHAATFQLRPGGSLLLATGSDDGPSPMWTRTELPPTRDSANGATGSIAPVWRLTAEEFTARFAAAGGAIPPGSAADPPLAVIRLSLAPEAGP